MVRTLVLGALALLLAAGCGGGESKAKVKGQIVDNEQPMSFGPTQVAVEFSPLDENGKPDVKTVYSAVVNENGSFEVVASNGELPPGKYRVSILATGKLKARFQAFAPGKSRIDRELDPGMNEVTIDVAKPDGG